MDPELPTRRILALDGGGLRAFFTLEVLARVESFVREELGRPDAVLADYFHLFAGTSTGAIVGVLLAWGLSVEEVRKLYQQTARGMFRRDRHPFAWFLRARYREDPLAAALRTFLVEEDGQEATLGSPRLRARYLAVARNASTGSAWPLCSHPALRFNDPTLPDSNLRVPLWQIVRASTAAPTYFAPERIALGAASYQFVDGGVTPYNNPALIAALMVTEPAYGIRWPTGEQRLYVLSVGTGRRRVRYRDSSGRRWNWQGSLPVVMAKTLGTLVEGTTNQQDFLCRVLGRCLYGATVDSEVGDLVPPADADPARERRFSYVRYNSEFPEDLFAPVLARHGGSVPMDRPALIPQFEEMGRRYADEAVRAAHLR